MPGDNLRLTKIEEVRNQEPILELQNLCVYFKAVQELGLGRQNRFVKAVDNLNLKIYPGEVLSIVGESGSGKTSAARSILGLVKPTSGRIIQRGSEINVGKKKNLRRLWKKTQMIFQDPYSTFNPLVSVLDSLEIPIRNFHLARSESEARMKITDTLSQVGLNYKELEGKYPDELSGGQKQRLSIARALIVDPEILVADEPVSMLDVSLRAWYPGSFARPQCEEKLDSYFYHA